MRLTDDRLYRGAKLALFIGPGLVTVLRDDIPTIPWPGYWDFPGGGREGAEHPEICAIRETYEETSIEVSPHDLTWAKAYKRNGHWTWFFAAHLDTFDASTLRLGNEGQRLEVWTPEAYVAHPKGIPHFKERLLEYLEVRKTV